MNKQSTAYDSQATNDYSSSSNDASKKNEATPATGSERVNNVRPSPIDQAKAAGGIAKASEAPTAQRHEETIGARSLHMASSKASLKKEPQLDRENFVNGHLKKFLAHVETRELNRGSTTWDPQSATQHTKTTKRSKLDTQGDDDEHSSSRSKSSESGPNKDNEDPNAVERADAFDPKEKRQEFEGWGLYKKTRISFAPVRRYQFMVDQDYKKNKVTVCAHLQNIYNHFTVKRGKALPHQNNYFDIDKWQCRMGAVKKEVKDANSPSKELRRINTLATPFNQHEEAPAGKDNFLLSKSNSTAHIPECSRAKNVRRAYANFDKDLAVKMFGYRVVF